MVTAAFTLSSGFIARHPTQSLEYKVALLEAAAWISSNPDEARRILPKYTNIDPALAPKVRLVRYADVNEVVKDLEFLASWMKDRGILEQVPSIEGLLLE